MQTLKICTLILISLVTYNVMALERYQFPLQNGYDKRQAFAFYQDPNYRVLINQQELVYNERGRLSGAAYCWVTFGPKEIKTITIHGKNGGHIDQEAQSKGNEIVLRIQLKGGRNHNIERKVPLFTTIEARTPADIGTVTSMDFFESSTPSVLEWRSETVDDETLYHHHQQRLSKVSAVLERDVPTLHMIAPQILSAISGISVVETKSEQDR